MSHRVDYQVLNIIFLIYEVGIIVPIAIDEETEHREVSVICPNHAASKQRSKDLETVSVTPAPLLQCCAGSYPHMPVVREAVRDFFN